MKFMKISMKLLTKFNKFRNTTVFIHGFRKDISSWNKNDRGTDILIEETLSQVSNTVLIQLDDEDYKKNISETSEQIYDQLNQLLTTKITLVAHSQGSFYAICLSELYPNIFGKLLLIDPTVKRTEYLELLKDAAEGLPEDSTERYKVKNFDELPTGETLSPKIIVRIHLNFIEESMSKISYLNKLTNKNAKSRFIIHYNIGHMIHWVIPHVIMDSIKKIIKL